MFSVHLFFYLHFFFQFTFTILQIYQCLFCSWPVLQKIISLNVISLILFFFLFFTKIHLTDSNKKFYNLQVNVQFLIIPPHFFYCCLQINFLKSPVQNVFNVIRFAEEEKIWWQKMKFIFILRSLFALMLFMLLCIAMLFCIQSAELWSQKVQCGSICLKLS